MADVSSDYQSRTSRTAKTERDQMMLSIKSTLIDGNSTKKFKSIQAAAKFVKEMEDFGEDGRRSWGFQGEFGTHEFIGFTWAEVNAAWKSAVEVEIIDCAEWSLFEWDYGCGGSIQIWAHRFNVRLDGTVYDVKSVQGRFQVEFIEYQGPDDFATVLIGIYKSMAAAVDACQRHYAVPKAEPSFVNDAFWQTMADRQCAALVGSNAEIPF